VIYRKNEEFFNFIAGGAYSYHLKINHSADSMCILTTFTLLYRQTGSKYEEMFIQIGDAMLSIIMQSVFSKYF
jgi:hypothetical protein